MARHIAIWMDPIALGVYKSTLQAENAIIDYLVDNRSTELMELVEGLREYYGIELPLDRLHLHKVLLRSDLEGVGIDDCYYDVFLESYVSFTIESSTRFQFDNWVDWELNSMYRLASLLLTGATGDVGGWRANRIE